MCSVTTAHKLQKLRSTISKWHVFFHLQRIIRESVLYNVITSFSSTRKCHIILIKCNIFKRKSTFSGVKSEKKLFK